MTDIESQKPEVTLTKFSVNNVNDSQIHQNHTEDLDYTCNRTNSPIGHLNISHEGQESATNPSNLPEYHEKDKNSNRSRANSTLDFIKNTCKLNFDKNSSKNTNTNTDSVTHQSHRNESNVSDSAISNSCREDSLIGNKLTTNLTDLDNQMRDDSHLSCLNNLNSIRRTPLPPQPPSDGYISNESFHQRTSNHSNTSENNNNYTVHYYKDVGNPLKLNPAELALEEKQCRFMSKNGRYLVKHVKHKQNKFNQKLVSDFFTTFVDMKWRYTLISFAGFFLISWVIFACLYYLIESVYYASRLDEFRKLNSINASSNLTELGLEEPVWGDYCIGATSADNKFTSMFLFSLETQTTIGYGYRAITADCPLAIIILIVQSVIGCLRDLGVDCVRSNKH